MGSLAVCTVLQVLGLKVQLPQHFLQRVGPEGDVVERDALLVGATVDYRTLSAVAQHKRFFKKLSRSVEANPEIGIDRC